jgi:purine-binding chemotaxis protein CheW
MEPTLDTESASSSKEFLLFSVGPETFGCPLGEVKDVVEKPDCTPVPGTIDSFLGVCNLKGQITGVIDLRIHFRSQQIPSKRPVLILYEVHQGNMAVVVDSLGQIIKREPNEIENQPNITTILPQNYILGVTQCQDKIVTLLNLKFILVEEELRMLSQKIEKQVA